MKLKKTPRAKRTQYVYTYYDADGNKKQEYIISGENGVTEEQIKKLHALDDREVYYNLKNSRKQISDDENADLTDRSEDYPNSEMPFNSVGSNDISLEFCMEYPYTKEAKEIIEQTCTYFDDVSPEVERLREIVQTLTPIERAIYKLVLINGLTNVEAAARLSMSEANVRYYKNKILDFIKKNFK